MFFAGGMNQIELGLPTVFPSVVRVLSKKIQADHVVIGSGPAGLAYAHEASRQGRKVTIIDSQRRVGGASLHLGTVPSKTMWQAVKELSRNPTIRFDYSDLRARISGVVDEERKQVLKELAESNVDIIYGMAKFRDAHQISVFDDSNNEIAALNAKRVFIATGSEPRDPPRLPFDGRSILSSSQLLEMNTKPKRLTVVGAGVIGTEYASIFTLLGSQVTLVDKNVRPLTFIDEQLSIRLTEILTSRQLRYIPNNEVSDIEKSYDGVRVHLADGEILESDVLLYAQGRVPNTKQLGLDTFGLEMSPRGHIQVNDLFQSISHPNISAGGDVIGKNGLASTAWREGFTAARYACGSKVSPFPEAYPTGIFTHPEIACCGSTEEDLKKKKIDYVAGIAEFSMTTRNKIAGQNSPGFFKLLFDPISLQILGGHIIGEDACDMIHYVKAVIDLKGPVNYFINSISNYPTRSGEGLREAAKNGMEKLSHRKRG